MITEKNTKEKKRKDILEEEGLHMINLIYIHHFEDRKYTMKRLFVDKKLIMKYEGIMNVSMFLFIKCCKHFSFQF